MRKKSSPMQCYARYLGGVGLLVVLDQITKKIAHTYLLGQPPLDVLPVLQWGLVFNRGAAFGFLNQAGGYQHYFFISIALITIVVIAVWLWRVGPFERVLAWGLSLILAGAIGNLIDRTIYYYVIDFINIHYQNWYFPAFNIADIAITFGACCLIISHIIEAKNK